MAAIKLLSLYVGVSEGALIFQRGAATCEAAKILCLKQRRERRPASTNDENRKQYSLEFRVSGSLYTSGCDHQGSRYAPGKLGVSRGYQPVSRQGLYPGAPSCYESISKSCERARPGFYIVRRSEATVGWAGEGHLRP
jgi:hypothetical protein